MFSFFRKSPEKIAHELYPLARELGDNLGDLNPLNLPIGVDLSRWRINANFFSNLAAQETVLLNLEDKQRSLETIQWLARWLLGSASSAKLNQWKVADFVLWAAEREMQDRASVDGGVRLHVSSDIPIPLPEIVRALAPIRLWRLKDDFERGAHVQLQKGSWSLAMYMPASATLIMQSTGNSLLAHDEKIVTELAVALKLQHFPLLAKTTELVG
jgi:hypothetical protein